MTATQGPTPLQDGAMIVDIAPLTEDDWWVALIDRAMAASPEADRSALEAAVARFRDAQVKLTAAITDYRESRGW